MMFVLFRQAQLQIKMRPLGLNVEVQAASLVVVSPSSVPLLSRQTVCLCLRLTKSPCPLQTSSTPRLRGLLLQPERLFLNLCLHSCTQTYIADCICLLEIITTAVVWYDQWPWIMCLCIEMKRQQKTTARNRKEAETKTLSIIQEWQAGSRSSPAPVEWQTVSLLDFCVESIHDPVRRFTAALIFSAVFYAKACQSLRRVFFCMSKLL